VTDNLKTPKRDRPCIACGSVFVVAYTADRTVAEPTTECRCLSCLFHWWENYYA